MTRLNLVLLIAVLFSALYLVRTQYESRRLYVELEKAAAQRQKIDTDSERLRAEKRAQATPLRIEQLSKDRLQMRTATPAITQYVTYKAPMHFTACNTLPPEGAVPARGGPSPRTDASGPGGACE
jgi:cell division protein FtsL